MSKLYLPAKVLLLLATSFAYSITSNAQADSSALRPAKIDVQTVLSWLPIDTESVIVADVHKGSFLTAKTFKRREEDNEKSRVLSLNQVAALFEGSALSFLGLNNGSVADLLRNHHVALALQGARHFRAPRGLGEMTFEGCEIAVFTDSLGNPQDLPKRFNKRAIRQEQFEGFSINVFEEKLEEDIWTIFVAFPEPNILLIASNVDYLRQVLRRMKKPYPGRALPESLPEWKYINAQSPFWGLRHYDRSQAELDPSSPFGGSKAANKADEKAVGLVYNFDPSQGRVATVIYMTGDKENSGAIEADFRNLKNDQEAGLDDLQVTVRELEPGVVARYFRLSKSVPVSYFFLILEGLLGHAMYL